MKTLRMSSNSCLARNSLDGVAVELDSSKTQLCSTDVEYPFNKYDASSVTNFLILVNSRRGWTSPRCFWAYLSQARAFLKVYSGEELVRLIKKAGRVAKHPFGFNFIKILGEQSETKTYFEGRPPK